MSTESRVAAIDIGTNSVLLLIAEASRAGAVAVEDRATITRLGAGVDQSRRLNDEACARTLSCLGAYAEIIRGARVRRLDVVGTSALRDARGAEEFLNQAERLLGARPRVIDGDEEARLTFSGALSGLALEGPVTVFDVGGGSTEIIAGEVVAGEPRVMQARSLDIGSVRLYERHVQGDPPSATQLASVRADVLRALEHAPMTSSGARLVGVAGTVTTLAAMLQQLDPYDGARVHGSTLDAADVEALASELARLSTEERRKLPGLDAKRADVIVVGAVLAIELMRWAGAQTLLVSDRGVRWGLVQELLGA
jgi:exopolyphosphatase/guanosine-5'-triphosphate,3'-diphosphate pyrophosphatase